jgi:hypothetical protein
MAISFSCPVCGHKLRANNDAAGKSARCKCGYTVYVPSPTNTLNPPPPAPPTAIPMAVLAPKEQPAKLAQGALGPPATAGSKVLLTAAVFVAIIGLIGGPFCLLMAGDFRYQTPSDMSRESARTTSNLLIVAGGLLLVGTGLFTPFALKHSHPRLVDQQFNTTAQKPGTAENLDGSGLVCPFCRSKPTSTSGAISVLGINPLWKIYVILFSVSLPLIVLIYNIPMLFDKLAHSKDQTFGPWLIAVIPPLASVFLIAVLGHVLNLSVGRRCASCKARWHERFSFGQFWKEFTK